MSGAQRSIQETQYFFNGRSTTRQDFLKPAEDRH